MVDRDNEFSKDITTGLDYVLVEEVRPMTTGLIHTRKGSGVDTKFLRILSIDDEFEQGGIYIGEPSCLERVATRVRLGTAHILRARKHQIVAKIEECNHKWETVMEVSNKMVKAVVAPRKGVPQFEDDAKKSYAINYSG